MEPLVGFILFFAACVIVAVVARKRGRAGWVYFLACLVSGPLLTILVAQGGGTGTTAAFVAFMGPVVGLLVVLLGKDSKTLAVEKGAFGEYRKCPFCAESVRSEAVKCKHCGSAIEPV